MSLSDDLISQYVEVNAEEKEKKEETLLGKIVSYNGKQYVKLDGSDQLTPIASTSSVDADDRVTVLLKNHSAIVTGNLSYPSAKNSKMTEISDKVDEFGNILAYSITTENIDAINAYFENLTAITAKYENMEAVNAEIERLNATYANLDRVTAEDVEALNADIENLRSTFVNATNITTEDLEAANAEINNLKAYNANFTYVSADVLSAINGKITNLDATYANIDFANITEAAVGKIFSDSGIIKDIVVSEGRITGELVGVTIKGDIIEGGTVKADKLVVKGSDGLFYKLNTDGVTITAEQTEYNSLNGTVITAKSITAEKVAVDDLVAFDATIGGFNITDSSIYSGVKTEPTNTTTGVYFDKYGQMAIGDATDFIKYYKDQNGVYKLEISADSILFGSSKKSVGTKIEQNEYQISLRATSESVSEEINSTNSKISELEAKLDIQKQSITSFVKNAQGGSLVKQDANGVCYLDTEALADILTEKNTESINDVKTDISDLLKDTEYLKTKTEYIAVGTDENDKPYIELGEGDSGFKVKITNEQIQFKDGQSVPAYITNKKLMIEKAEVVNELRFGNFVWKSRNNGNMGLTWEEANS